ncbi:MAG: ATP-dependent DNA helicase RecG [Halothiobacillaceae bacterium]
MASMDAPRPITELKGVGPALGKRLARLGIETVQDLLLHLPFRYQDRGTARRLAEILPGEEALVEVTVVEARALYRGKARCVVAVTDGDRQATVWFFGQHGPGPGHFPAGRRLRLFGEFKQGAHGLDLAHPEVLTDASDSEYLQPVYPTTEGLGQIVLRRLMRQALALQQAERLLSDRLPAEIRHQHALPTLDEALTRLHMPARSAGPPHADDPARRRLVLEELIAQHLALRMARRHLRHDPAPVLNGPGRLHDRLLESLPFAPTGAQERVLSEIRADLARPTPMLRLVQGDVGSGKTLVAAGAALTAIEAGHQVALMAPTALLAEQHARNLATWLEPLGVRTTLLSGLLAERERKMRNQALADGEIHLAVGTHALFQESVQFHRLGLVIVDEQHRFGVHQRLALTAKGPEGARAHQLVMTATPIPRTLAMSAYADLDLSVIDELPPGRTPVTTVAINAARRDEIIARIAEVCAEGRQAYWVCPLIEESEAIDAQAAESTAQSLAEQLPHLRIGLVHGRMKTAEKNEIMQRFKAHELDLLVATTVIEVGVDVPNASLMLIENAERLGLAQLHQLRGRVGRGATASHCVLLFEEPLGDRARARLALMRETQDGFRIAEEDLRLRGPGEVLGTRQTGPAQMRVADLARDGHLLEEAREASDRLLDQHPEQVEPLIRRWVGQASEYGRV